MKPGGRWRVRSVATALCLAAVVFGCVWLASHLVLTARSSRVASPTAERARTLPDSEEARWEKRWWIDKTARLLRGGAGLGSEDDIEALMRLPREEIARRFMQDPRFGDAILDFNLFFLGFKPDNLRNDGGYDRSAFDFPNAIASAQAILRGGDYLTLFDLRGPYYMAPLRSVPLDDPPAPEDAGLTTEQLRVKAIGELRGVLSGLAELGAEAQPSANASREMCQRMLKLSEQVDWWNLRVQRAFDDWEGFALNRASVVTAPIDKVGRTALSECYGKSGVPADLGKLTAGVRAALELYDRTFKEILSFAASQYQPDSVLAFRPFDLNVLADQPKWLAFGFEQGLALGNSSTNANRRRGAYVLKRYFCDDLTPVGIEAPKQHAVTGPIGQPSCQACHYKLDPMAGFFRDYGAFFFDFSKAQVIAFDDLALADRASYAAGWQAPPQSPRPWNVGYIRSTVSDSLNSYGDSIADLSRIIRTTPEPKRCLMRRLFEYAVAPDQTIDGAWLDWLTRKFEAEAQASSAEAMRNAIVRVVTSDAFLQRDADPNQCYDRAPGARAKDAPPCRVAFVLEKNCARCHESVRESAGRLDLTKWTATADGRGHAFPHLDEHERPLAPAASLSRFIARLTTDDPDLRMPKGKTMTSQERQELYLWAQDELARLNGGAAK